MDELTFTLEKVSERKNEIFNYKIISKESSKRSTTVFL